MRKQISIDEDTYDLIMVECYREFLRNNPMFIDAKITQDFILKRIAKYYLGEKQE